MEYFLAIDGKPIGPLPKGRLLQAGMKKDTLVWRDGLSGWVVAKDLTEVKDLFPVVPPPIPVHAKMPPIPPVVQPPHPTVQPTVQPQQPPQTFVQSPVQPQYNVQPQQPVQREVQSAKWQMVVNGNASDYLSKCALVRNGLMPDTQVRQYGSDTWVQAGDVPELKAIMEGTPMPGTEQLHVKYMISVMAQGGFNNTTGFLHIYEDYISINPSGALSVMNLNFSKTGYVRQFYGFDEIVQLKKGFMNRKYIFLSDGTKVLIGAYGKVFVAIRNAHARFYASRGLQAPSLD